MPTGPSRNSPSLRSRRGMHRRTVTGVSERTFARRNSSTNCLISHSPRTQRLVKEAVRDAGRPGRGSSPRSSRLAPDGHLRGRLASGPGRATGWPRSARPRWTLGAGTPARWSRRSAMSPWWGTTPRHPAGQRGGRPGTPTAKAGHHGPSGPHLRPAVPHPQAAGDRGRAAHPAGTGAAAGPRHHEDRTRGRQDGESRQHQVASVVGSSVTVPNHVSMRTRSSPATSEIPHPPSSPRDTTDVTGVAPAGRWARHQT